MQLTIQLILPEITHSRPAGKRVSGIFFNPGLYSTIINSDDTTSTVGPGGYGYYYDFSKFYGQGAVAGRGVCLPAYEPAVFELKDSNDNIKGLVR